ncbi:hypothetical protein BDFB_007643 [Asbolus verrucosus]|uniref:Uncharacterized protein n=1 Tax=Asbolus verrucosus TaxID=1661398 RepID=A0A482V9J1_ASBVE|nr:hypothetical protein BDFB_007643 [Asbolus verrucosus]
MTVPAPILAPTTPEAVKPSSLPCPQTVCKQVLIRGERDISGDRYDNFYNNYNINSTESCESKPWTCDNFSPKRFGVTVDGKSPCCDISKREDDRGPLHGYPTGFKSCTMKLTPPPYCDPFLPWCAEIQPCPPKSKKKKRTVC